MEEVARWSVPPVTARHVVIDGEVLAGHQGEWFSVLAGALGRAFALSEASLVERITAWIEAELTREARLVAFARKNGTPEELLSVVTTVAHNVGDLLRVKRHVAPAHAESERFATGGSGTKTAPDSTAPSSSPAISTRSGWRSRIIAFQLRGPAAP